MTKGTAVRAAQRLAGIPGTVVAVVRVLTISQPNVGWGVHLITANGSYDLPYLYQVDDILANLKRFGIEKAAHYVTCGPYEQATIDAAEDGAEDPEHHDGISVDPYMF